MKVFLTVNLLLFSLWASGQMYSASWKPSSSETYSTELQAWIDEVEASGGTAPTSAQLLLLEDVIDDLQTASLWSGVFDAVYIFDQNGSRIAGQVNFIDPDNYELTIPGSTPAWTSNEGITSYASGAGSGYFDSNFNPSTAGGYYLQSDCSMIAIVEGLDVISNNKYFYAAGATDGSNGDAYIYFYGNQAADDFNSRANDDTTQSEDTGSAQGDDDAVMYTFSRTGASAVAYYENASSLNTSTTASTSRPNYDFFIGTVNSSGTPTLVSQAAEIKLVAWGESLTSTQVSNFWSAWSTFLSSQ